MRLPQLAARLFRCFAAALLTVALATARPHLLLAETVVDATAPATPGEHGTAVAPAEPGALPSDAIVETVTGRTTHGAVMRWATPVLVEVRRATAPDQEAAVDELVEELRPLLGHVPVARVPAGGNVVVVFGPHAQLATAGWLGPGVGGVARLRHHGATTDLIDGCEVAVADDPQSYLPASAAPATPEWVDRFVRFVLRHEVGHCLGLSHNAAPESVMSSQAVHWGPYSALDRAIIGALYGPRVAPGMFPLQVRAALDVTNVGAAGAPAGH